MRRSTRYTREKILWGAPIGTHLQNIARRRSRAARALHVHEERVRRLDEALKLREGSESSGAAREISYERSARALSGAAAAAGRREILRGAKSVGVYFRKACAPCASSSAPRTRGAEDPSLSRLGSCVEAKEDAHSAKPTSSDFSPARIYHD